MKIRRAAVIGAGTMGSGIAGHLANAGVDVVLLDVAADAADRDALASGALERMRERDPPPFMHPDNAARISTGNIEDHLDRVSDCDWIVEAIVERIDAKRDLYDPLERVRRPGSVVSSNTSTLPLSLLTERMSDALRGDFCITHFFNPVRFMRLLEIVRGPDTRPEVIEGLASFCDVELGKGVVHCRDTPGFLANRVGVHALQAGLCEAQAQGVTVEQADAVMARPMGIPKTALFGLYDLIGLDLMLDVAASLAMALPPDDAFQQVAHGIPVLHDLVAAGYTGNKGAGGFYRAGPHAREVVELDTGVFRPVVRAPTEAAVAGERHGLRAMAEHPSAAGRFARRMLARVLGYAASLVPEVSDAPHFSVGFDLGFVRACAAEQRWAALARPLRLLRDADRSTMNRDRLLADAKASALELADGYAPPGAPAIVAPGAPAHDAMCEMLDDLARKGVALAHDRVVSRCLARVLAGGDLQAGRPIDDEALFELEREAFLTLARTPETSARIACMLDRGRPLRN